ncbi:hypothetical protein L345_16283, partial [Ophiophagus hannah]
MENPDQCKTQNKERQEIDQDQIDQQQVLFSFRQIFPLLDTPLSCTQHVHHETLDSSVPSWSPHSFNSTGNSKDHQTTSSTKRPDKEQWVETEQGEIQK